jgi:hypothetical protein
LADFAAELLAKDPMLRGRHVRPFLGDQPGAHRELAILGRQRIEQLEVAADHLPRRQAVEPPGDRAERRIRRDAESIAEPSLAAVCSERTVEKPSAIFSLSGRRSEPVISS